MKKCVVCRKEIEKKEEVCETCRSFFQWKYKEDFEEKIQYFTEYTEEMKSLTKFGRKK